MNAGDDDSLSLEETITAPTGSPAERWARVRVVHPPESVMTVDVPGDGGVLGRKPGEDGLPRVRSRTVSRRHLEIAWDDTLESYTARDLSSRNGTALDGDRLQGEPRPLADNAVLRLGDVVMIFEWGREALPTPVDTSTEVVPGRSVAAARLRATLAEAAPDTAPALLVGAHGTGKEYVATELHALSGRTGRLVTTSCAALRAQVARRQLFGHEQGAFPGATAAHQGLFRAADRGTLFLDELHELPLELQPTLLRVVERGEVQPVGRDESVRVDVRIVTATHRDLGAEVERGRFRRDLYEALSRWELRVPPLSARRADILEWMERLHARWCARRALEGTAPPRLSADAAEAVLLAPWSENLRGLDRLVHELADLSDGDDHEVSYHDLPAWVRLAEVVSPLPPTKPLPATPVTPLTPRSPMPEAMSAPTRDELLEALRRNRGSVTATARDLGADRRRLRRWLEIRDIDPDETPPG